MTLTLVGLEHTGMRLSDSLPTFHLLSVTLSFASPSSAFPLTRWLRKTFRRVFIKVFGDLTELYIYANIPLSFRAFDKVLRDASR